MPRHLGASAMTAALPCLQNLDQWTMRQSLLELQLMIKQTANNVSGPCGCLGVAPVRGRL